jgi:hypothetical protein
MGIRLVRHENDGRIPEEDPVIPFGDHRFAQLIENPSQAASMLRSTRGGSYTSTDEHIRNGAPAIRGEPPAGKSPEIGFRVARSAIK